MATTVSDLDGLFKQVYSTQGIINLMPETAMLVKKVPFSVEDKIGKLYNQPVSVTYEQGVTYAAPGSGAFALNDAISMKLQNAEVNGYQIILSSTMDYESAAKAESGGRTAFRKATQLQVENMLASITKRVETACFYGQSGLAQTSGSTNVSTTSTTIQITTATWATGIWSGMENSQIQFWTAANALVSSGADSIFSIDSIDIENRRLTVTGTSTGITALDSAAGSGTLDIFFNGARTGASTYQEMIGLNKIVTNSSSTLFNISASDYSLWAGNTYSVGSASLTLGKIMSGLAKPISKGLNEKVSVFLNDKTWANVASDQAALRKYDASYSADLTKNGSRAITFYSGNGEIELLPYTLIKEGDAFALPLKRIKRIGAWDISFNSPGRDGTIFRELTAAAGFEYRVYTDQSIFCETPSRTLKFTGIVNS